MFLRSYTLGFAKLDLDISEACIKGKKPTAIIAIHMHVLLAYSNIPHGCWQEYNILVFKLFVKYWLKFIVILLKDTSLDSQYSLQT